MLLSFAVKRRRVFPSLETIARMAMVKQTVVNALAWLALYGFLDKLRRIVRTTGLLGPRVRQTSNAYVLRFPKGLGGLAVNVFGFDAECNNCTPSDSNSEAKKSLQGSGFDFEAPPVQKPQVSGAARFMSKDWRDRARRAAGWQQ